MLRHQFNTCFGSFALRRWPLYDHDPLRAWDAADEYLLNEYVERASTIDEPRSLIMNDAFGALALALHKQQPFAISDSFLSHAATRHNLQQHGIESAVTLLESLGAPEMGQAFDFVLIKIPKTLALFEYQMQQIRPWLKPTTQVIAAAMLKHMTPAANQILQRFIGPCHASLAWKKARLLFAAVDPLLIPPPIQATVGYRVAESGLFFQGYANVFSRERLDIGSRFLLQHLPQPGRYKNYVDLGCGNGVIGVHLALQQADAALCFIDESYMALASAAMNFRAAFGEARQARFVAADGLNDIGAATVDCVVVNPPFHQQHTVGDQTAVRMFQQAHTVLRSGGELRVIGNRHLGYHQRLKQIFGRYDLIAANPKFVVLRAIKP
jgi:23S rRNA (guanine1835-N2)-methyltransferase